MRLPIAIPYLEQLPAGLSFRQYCPEMLHRQGDFLLCRIRSNHMVLNTAGIPLKTYKGLKKTLC